MINNVNYHRLLAELLIEKEKKGEVPSLLLHSCCAPCSSYCLEFLSHYTDITVFYFNPNITSEEEYRMRFEEQKRLIEEMPFERPVKLIEGRYNPESFFEMAKGLEAAPERGPRCRNCYEMRLKETAKIAVQGGFDYFATTLTLSPLKPSGIINDIGFETAKGLEGIYKDIKLPEYLASDFKKNNGYKRSIELSAQYNLYRQNYCGCVFSKRQA